MPTEAQATSELAKALVAFFLGGLGATAIILMPGYLLGVVFARGLRGPAHPSAPGSPTPSPARSSSTPSPCPGRCPWLGASPTTAPPPTPRN
jgi:hypothetical protein